MRALPLVLMPSSTSPGRASASSSCAVAHVAVGHVVGDGAAQRGVRAEDDGAQSRLEVARQQVAVGLARELVAQAFRQRAAAGVGLEQLAGDVQRVGHAAAVAAEEERAAGREAVGELAVKARVRSGATAPAPGDAR